MERSQSTSKTPAGNLILLVPAYRPGQELVRMIADVLCQDGGRRFRRVVLVDDGSGAEYSEVFDAARANGNVSIVRHAVNLGKGAALKSGFNHCLVEWPDAAGVVTADADGQHTAPDILRVADALEAHPAQVVLGIRRFDKGVPSRSRVGNLVTRAVFRAVTGISLHDTQTGLRGWPRAYCASCLRIRSNGFDFELECLLRARSGPGEWQAPLQVTIQTVYAEGNRSSHFDPLLDSMRIYFVFLRYCASSSLAAVVDSLTFYLALGLWGDILLSQACGRVAGVLIVFGLLRRFVFHARGSLAVSLAKYLVLVVVMALVSYGLIRSLHDVFGVPVLAAKLLAEGTLFLGNFAIQREFVFARR